MLLNISPGELTFIPTHHLYPDYDIEDVRVIVEAYDNDDAEKMEEEDNLDLHHSCCHTICGLRLKTFMIENLNYLMIIR